MVPCEVAGWGLHRAPLMGPCIKFVGSPMALAPFYIHGPLVQRISIKEKNLTIDSTIWCESLLMGVIITPGKMTICGWWGCFLFGGQFGLVIGGIRDAILLLRMDCWIAWYEVYVPEYWPDYIGPFLAGD